MVDLLYFSVVLLSYYIAAINIESTFAEINHEEYKPFEGIVLTDTFESTEQEDTLDDTFFGTNDERLKRQQEVPITAIIGNPPYSVGQSNANDNNKNIEYLNLNKRIEETYSKYSNANLNKGLYDSYIKAVRWSSDRLSGKGIIGFVSNASFIDSQTTDGLRKCLYEEFNYLYIFNLRGDQRTQGETSRKEGGKIFGSGSRTPIAISILVKDGSEKHEIQYFDIGDYLTREEKLNIVNVKESINSIDWKEIIPDKHNDWINKRDENYSSYPKIAGEIFEDWAVGANTSRDSWVISFSKEDLSKNVQRMIEQYEIERSNMKLNDSTADIDRDSSKIKWSSGLIDKLNKQVEIVFNSNSIQLIQYRPFAKKYIYYENNLVERPGKYRNWEKGNPIIFVTGKGAKREFSTEVIDLIPSFDLMEKGQGFYKWHLNEGNLLSEKSDNINDTKFGLSTEDTFYYVYGLLHSKAYRENYASDLKKELPRIPEVKDKEKYVEIGKKLADLHLNYEDVPAYDGVNIVFKSDNPSFKVKKMKHPKRGQLDTIIFNEDIVITDIPERAYEYVVNGKPAIEWIIDQYQVKKDKKSGIVDDPNEFSDNPKYIFNLLLSIINVSLQTMDLVESLPPLEIIV